MAARLGVIGTGWWATRAHLPAIEQNPDAELVAIADPHDQNRERARSRFDVPKVFADFREMLDREELDGVVVAVPHAAHYEVTLEALRHDLHVLLEKPMVLDPVEGEELVRESARRGRELIIGYPWHFNPQSLQAQAWIREGRIGEILYVHSLFASIVWELYRGHPQIYAEVLGYPVNAPGERTYADPAISGGGQGQTQVTHSAALLFFLTGLTPEEVFAYMDHRDLEVDLIDAIAVRFREGCVGLVGSTGSTVKTQPEILEYRIYGTDGHILFDVNEGHLSLHLADGSAEDAKLPSEEERYPEAAPVNNLVGVVLDRDFNGSPAEIGLRAVEFLHSAYASARQGRPVQIEGQG